MMKSSDLSDCVLIRLIRVVFLSTLLGHVPVAGVQFIKQPAEVTKTYTYGRTEAADSFFLDCQVDSLESTQKVSWFKNGEIISDGYDFRDNVMVRLVDVVNDRYRIISYNTPLRFSLQVRSVSPSTAEFDSGSYQCAVTWWQNDAAVPGGRSRTAEVKIYVIPTSNYPVCRVSNPSGQDVITAERTTATTTIVLPSVSHTLTCLSGQSTPVAGLLWSRNDQSGSPTGESTGLPDTSIAIDWIPSRNDGPTLTFTCTLQHPGLSSDRTCSITFNIQYAPIVTIDPTDVMVTEENDEITLHCFQDANPQVTEPVWYYDDDVVNSGGRFSPEGLSLGISTFSSRDNGDHTVTCELTNAIGTGSDSITLTVNIPTSTQGALPRTASSGITVPDNNGRNKSNSTDPFAIPRKSNNIGIIIGSVVGICLLIAVIIILVILIGLKTRRKSSQSPKSSGDDFDARRGESGGDVIGVVTEDTTSPSYRSTNGAFGNEYSDIALELGATLKTGSKQKAADSDTDNRSDNVNSAELYSKPKKKPKPPYKKKTNQQKTEDEQYANMGFKAKAISATQADEPSVDLDMSPYANMSEKQNQAIDSRQVHKQRRGDAKVSKTEKPAFEKNVEGLTYAELDLSSTSVTSRPKKMPEAENTVYADLQL